MHPPAHVRTRFFDSLIHSFTYSIVRDLINEPLDDVMRSINNKIGTIGDQINLQETLNSDITFNAKLKVTVQLV